MKKVIFMTLFMLFSITCFGQFNMPNRMRPFINEKDYVLVDSLPLERYQTYVPDSNLIQHIQEHSPERLKENQIIQLGANEYVFELPVKDKIILRYNKDKTKAIITSSSIIHGMGLYFCEFNVKDDKQRQILYYEDKNILCVLSYDKKFKLANYFRYEKKEIGRRQFRRIRQTYRRMF